MPARNLKKTLRKKILLAEDDNSMRRFLEVTLQKLGYEVLTAEDGLGAMKIALENEIDAVVADAVMPNLTGYDLCRVLRAKDDKKHVPIIILSGFDRKDAAESESYLADAYLTKSNDVKEQLAAALSNFLSPKS